jgi:hypothetical protein
MGETMRSGRKAWSRIETLIRFVAVVSLLGSAATNYLVGLADVAGVSPTLHDLAVTSCAGLVALAGVVLYETFIGTG